MKQLSFLLAALLIWPAVSKADNACEAFIVKMKRLESRFTALDYSKDTDRGKGEDESYDAIEAIADWDKLPASDSCRPRAFKAFVDMAQAESPFDGEGGAAQVIEKRIRKDSKLNSIYQSSLSDGEHKDVCRRNLLRGMVSEDKCIHDAGGDNASGKASDNCATKYKKDWDYKACTSQKKSENSRPLPSGGAFACVNCAKKAAEKNLDLRKDAPFNAFAGLFNHLIQNTN